MQIYSVTFSLIFFFFIHAHTHSYESESSSVNHPSPSAALRQVDLHTLRCTRPSIVCLGMDIRQAHYYKRCFISMYACIFWMKFVYNQILGCSCTETTSASCDFSATFRLQIFTVPWDHLLHLPFQEHMQKEPGSIKPEISKWWNSPLEEIYVDEQSTVMCRSGGPICKIKCPQVRCAF